MVSGDTVAVALSLMNVRKSYGSREVLKGLNITVGRGECVALLGPNGAGKSTTVALALGLGHASGGAVNLLGFDMGIESHLARGRVGVVPQYDALDPDFTVLENLLVFGRYFGLRGRDLATRAGELLEFVKLADRAKDAVQALSGGMRRRLILARALINRPEMLFLDEPTTGLDPKAKHMIWDGLMALKREGMAVLLTSHDMDEAQRLADRVAVLDGGQVVAMDTPASLIANHVGEFVTLVWGHNAARFLQDQLKVDLTRVEQRGETWYFRDDTGSQVMARIRAARPVGVECLFRPGNLEDVFFGLTGRALSDA